MILRLTAALFALVAPFTALAQREPRLPFPAEKFSPRPVQPKQNAPAPAPLSATSEQNQQWRWEERSQPPSKAAK